ncbi:uncharacterized protein YceK [Sinomonas atrocyanea]|uniref:hypothetical protein n=1 Tax=Sinomonas atrocyanea TaxID=37927 RepID=UPI0027802520|nr:hypothetical protein [Sinomonas atrocyanea]MDP9882928.1 uncharacterized protein YceK [Sinomonas atrocyanea]
MGARLVRRLVALSCAALMMSGCAAVQSAPAPPEAAQQSAAAPSPSAASSAPATGPSSAAAMVCGQEIREKVAQILALPAAPSPSSTWAGGRYTCTYRLPSGALVLAVQESSDPAAARASAHGAVAALPGAAPIEGLANLGLPGYQSPAGTVAFAKDSFALTVDATGLKEPVGPHGVSRSSLAYQIATDVLACWSE